MRDVADYFAADLQHTKRLLARVGIPVLFLQRPNPWPHTFGYHEIWHVFVTVAAAFHFVAVASVLA